MRTHIHAAGQPRAAHAITVRGGWPLAAANYFYILYVPTREFTRARGDEKSDAESVVAWELESLFFTVLLWLFFFFYRFDFYFCASHTRTNNEASLP